MRGGPKTIKNMAAREPAKSCEGARSEPRRPKRYKNRGFERSRKVSKKVSFRRSGRPVISKNGRKRRFSIRFGLPRSSSFARFYGFFGFWRSGRGAKIAKTLRFCGFRVWWRFLGRPVFVKKKRVSEKVRKKFASQKTVRN